MTSLSSSNWSSPAVPDAALLIDWENIKSSLNSHGMHPSIAAIRDACEQYGRIVLARAYADWQDGWLRDDPRDLYAAGIEPVYVPVRRYGEAGGQGTVKNSVDVRLATDCVELIHTHPQIELYILASGDQDFIHVVNKLRPYGKRVVGLAVSWSASPRLAERVDHMIIYDRDIDPPPTPDVSPPSPVAAIALVTNRLAEVAESIATGEGLSKEDITKVVDAALEILRAHRTRGQEINVSVLGVELQRVLHSQMYSMVVRGRLQRIVRELDRLNALQIVRRGVDDWLYLPNESVEPHAPAPLLPQAPTRSRLDWDGLTPSVRAMAIGLVRGLKDDRRLDYLTFNRIAESIDEALLTDGANESLHGRDVASAMTGSGILVQDVERDWYDSFTGSTGTFWTLKLNAEHPEVVST